MWSPLLSGIADDLVLVSASEPQLRELLDIAGQVVGWADLKFNAWECASLSIDYTARRCVLPTVYEIGCAPRVSLSAGQEYCNVGVPTGFKQHKLQSRT